LAKVASSLPTSAFAAAKQGHVREMNDFLFQPSCDERVFKGDASGKAQTNADG
jgi:hypothetical protein